MEKNQLRFFKFTEIDEMVIGQDSKLGRSENDES